jgi:membrane-associated phospholipid phosphatase
MNLQHIPHFMGSIVIAALVVQVVCAIINVWWKISTHTAAIGGVAGALFVFAEYFGFNPVWWFCLVFILAGVLGSARMILRQHTLGQVVGGFLIGMACSVVGIIYL